MENTPPPVLSYDAHNPAKDPRGKRIPIVYCVGIVAAGGVYGIIGILLSRRDFAGDPMAALFIDGFAHAIAISLVTLLPAMFFLGLSLWIKQRLAKEVPFATIRTAIIHGFICGLFPLHLVRFLPDSDGWRIPTLISSLIWYCAVPAISGLLLCRRNHLRN